MTTDRAFRMRVAAAGAAALAPLVLVGLLVTLPELDVRWESQPAHFWLVLGAAALSLALAALVNAAA
jgi:hypothetical protein